MKALILGTGAIGSVIAGYLARGGRDVHAVDPWFQHVEKVKRDGLTIEAVEETFTSRFPIHNLDELDKLGTADIVVISVKSYDTTWIARLAREHLSEDTVVLSAQNGMNDAPISEIVGPERVVGCVVVMGAELLSAGHVKRTTAMDGIPLILGDFGAPAVSPRVKDVAQFFEPLGNVGTAPDVRPERWGKLTLNVTSNGLAGLTGLTTKEMWSTPAVTDVMTAIGHEVAMVAAARGIRMAPVLQQISHEQLAAATSTRTADWAQIRALLGKVAGMRTGKRENMPSLLQDIRRGRRTEVDYLNGWVAEQAEQVGVDPIMNRALISEIRSVEDGRRRPSPANLAPLSDLVTKHYS